MTGLNKSFVVIVVSVFMLFSGPATAAEGRSIGEPGRSGQSTKKPNPLKNVYFGEQHLHTTNSPDAFVVGVRQSWDEAYQWAMGKEVKLSTNGETIKKSTPYDFVAITDHAEYFGVMPSLIDSKDPLYQTDLAKSLRDPKADPHDPDSAINQIIGSLVKGKPMTDFVSTELQAGNWKRYTDTANKYNDPGKFTTLLAYEWTSIPNGRNMHRNVFFRDGKGPYVPFTAFDSIYPEDLWTFLETQRNQGTENFAIPHNGNLSDGWMFSPNTFLGGPMDARHAARQQANEPLTEIIQTKGSSDTHPLFSPNDEFANFEIQQNMINVGQTGQMKYSYYRQALADGMVLEDKLGSNPFKYGVAAGADAHSGYSNNEEFNFHGSHGVLDDTSKKRLDPTPNASGATNVVMGSAGTTAVWAEENTREAIFDGMKSKETYGTSGTLIRLRFFGGWDYPKNLDKDKDFVKKAYDGGVPMGQDLPKMAGKAPTFAVWAQKDPESGNLDRIQIIKAFVNKWGLAGEKIYDVAWSDNRKPDAATGKLPPVGNTVDVKKATYTNDIGDTQLSAVWTDPDFDPMVRAAYYVRVLEIPTPRWTTYDAAKLGVEPPANVAATIQERAWSSPIWYTPSQDLLIEAKLKEITGHTWGPASSSQ
ncbi:MAG: DUF3604 domain-containing protein [Xanthomonadales bacterium]|jgi:hypothetical protein|nr:DUF3604 domain-containing protein [Xanthomonadales bacterium]MDH3923871.1 DUF3604 domain-containing protein [Xanthomonadales bacterium]MDH4002500.1 DUF3604 domain-containing protein [Xanthomonadales bacterium]